MSVLQIEERKQKLLTTRILYPLSFLTKRLLDSMLILPIEVIRLSLPIEVIRLSLPIEVIREKRS